MNNNEYVDEHSWPEKIKFIASFGLGGGLGVLLADIVKLFVGS